MTWWGWREEPQVTRMGREFGQDGARMVWWCGEGERMWREWLEDVTRMAWGCDENGARMVWGCGLRDRYEDDDEDLNLNKCRRACDPQRRGRGNRRVGTRRQVEMNFLSSWTGTFIQYIISLSVVLVLTYTYLTCKWLLGDDYVRTRPFFIDYYR